MFSKLARFVRLAQRFGDRQTSHFDWLASGRFPKILALEVEPDRKAASFTRRYRLDVAVTALFQIVYLFVAVEIGSRRLVHLNVTEHPTAKWTLQQMREELPGDEDDKFLCMIGTAPSLQIWMKR